MPFTYADVTLEQLPWRVPILLPHQPPKKLPEGEFFPSRTARNTREYETCMQRSLRTLEGKVIVDLCSGKGNLDELADHNHLIRIDPLYSSQELRARLTRDSRCPDNIKLVGFCIQNSGRVPKCRPRSRIIRYNTLLSSHGAVRPYRLQ